MSLLKLGPKSIHIWLAYCGELESDAWKALSEPLLSPSEKARRDRYLYERNRHEYKVTRALVRTVLSRYAPVDPAHWLFDAGSHGKPFISGPSIDIPLCFNLSNTNGLVACIVALNRELGIDVEERARAARALDVADRFFAPQEVRALNALPQTERPLRFSAYWTLKEAYIKARGLGLAIPLDQFAFRLEPGRTPAIEIDARLNDDANRWQFLCMKPTRGHFLSAAISLHAQDERDRLEFSVRKTIPLIA